MNDRDFNEDLVTEYMPWTSTRCKKVWTKDMEKVSKEAMEEDDEYVIF